jgi:hypothetical protein
LRRPIRDQHPQESLSIRNPRIDRQLSTDQEKVIMDNSDKGCGPQLFNNDIPPDKWDIDRLGEFAATEYRAIVADETTLAPRYWRLGMALNLARKQIRHGKWMNFLKLYAIDKTRASKARAIHRTFESEQDLDGLTVEEAYARRERRGGDRTSDSEDAVRKLTAYLQTLSDCVGNVADEAQWNPPETVAELLSDLDQAISDLERLRQVLQSHVAASN